MKNFITSTVKLILILLNRLISERLINLVLREYNETNKKDFYTYHARPQHASDYHYDPYNFNLVSKEKLAIILQGPIKKEKNYTLNTIKLYRKNYPDALIILSTWEGENIALGESENLKILYNEFPNNRGALNFNLQKKSTLSGLLLAASNNAQFSIKTRTDQRLCAPNLDLLLREYLAQYPTHDDRPRIIESSVNICKYRPYSMCDVFQYSSTEELIRMWDIEDDNRSLTATELSNTNPSPIDLYNADVAEIRLHRRYAANRDHKVTPDLENYHKFITDYFLVIDKEILDLHFFKYTASEYNLSMNPLYSDKRILSRFTHSDWVLATKYGCSILNTDVDLELPESENV